RVVKGIQKCGHAYINFFIFQLISKYLNELIILLFIIYFRKNSHLSDILKM
ncbi:hypothetical protein D922_02659, partial [Enterococcus faecalis 06-MB-DW-09]